jgi:uncharacterized membrane-anchored protein
MPILPPDHPQRLELAAEVHARPPDALDTPSRATYVAALIEPEQRAAEREHLAALCARFGVGPPPAEAIHFAADFGPVRAKWERHSEFSSYTFFMAGQSPQPFSEPVASRLPEGWLAAIPGRTLFAAHGKLVAAGTAEPDTDFLAAHFAGNVVVGAEIGGGAGYAFTDFRIHADGFARVLLIDRSFTPRQAGRMLQRLFEIEAYRMMALLALPVAREQAQRIAPVERALAVLTDDIDKQTANDEALLQQLTRLAAEVERSISASQYRFGACRAYDALVTTRIAELRERQLPGIQTIVEFMSRRFTPAVATCASTSRRLNDLSERVSQASSLLSTRVDIAREKQNSMLLESMNRRGKLQLRLQQTVEGLSVAAIVYYAAGLVGYLAKGAKAAGAPIDPDLTIGIAIPVMTILVVLALRRAHRKVFRSEGTPYEP